MNRRQLLSAALASLTLPIHAGAVRALPPLPATLPEGLYAYGTVTWGTGKNSGRTYESVCSGTAIQSIQRIWEDGRLVYDARKGTV